MKRLLLVVLVVALGLSLAAAGTMAVLWRRAEDCIGDAAWTAETALRQAEAALQQLREAGARYWGVFSPENISKLWVGMSPQQVAAIFGEPSSVKTEQTSVGRDYGTVLRYIYHADFTAPNGPILVYDFSATGKSPECVFSFLATESGYRLVGWDIGVVSSLPKPDRSETEGK